MPPTRPAGGFATRRSSSLPSPSTRSALEDLAALAARLLGAPWAAVRLGDGDNTLDIIPSGLPHQAPPREFSCSAANWNDDTPRARIVLAGSTARTMSADEERTLAALDRQAAALLTLDREAAEAQAGIAPHFKTLLDHLPTAAFIKDEDHRYAFANRAFWKLCNGTGEEGDLREVDDSTRMTPETVERIRQRDLEVLQTGRKHEYIEKLEYDGKVHTWWVCKFPVAGPDGRPRVGGISLDISDLGQAPAGSRMNELIFKNIEVGVT
ncbi:MAG TPA: PAS domain-containing protein, partial [Fibrobacteria bacterium]|nr:PAS domain-containing protein [Fibrobacteria bacterium]